MRSLKIHWLPMIHTQDRRDEGALMETELCDNCNIAVPSIHFVMHVDFCKRNVQMCEDCGCAVPASQKEHHRQTFHVQINCSECGMAINAKSEEARHFARHCPQRPVGCRFCPLELPRHDIREHERNCDLKCERCEKCTEHVFVKDFVMHRQICNGDSELVVLPCEFCCASMSPNKLMAHQRDCASRRGIEVPDEQRIQPLPESYPEGAFGGARVIYSGEPRARQTTGCYERNSRLSSDLNHSDVALPCEICGELCPADKLIQHQKDCIKSQDRQSKDRYQRRHSGYQEVKPTSFVGIEDQGFKTRVTYVSSRAERERSLSNLEFEDDPDCDLDINARLPRSIETNVFCNGEQEPLLSSTPFSHRINFGRLRNSK